MRGKDRVKRTGGRGIHATTSWQMRDNRGSDKSDNDGDGDGDGQCRAPLSRDLAAAALVLAAEAAATLISDDADGGK